MIIPVAKPQPVFFCQTFLNELPGSTEKGYVCKAKMPDNSSDTGNKEHSKYLLNKKVNQGNSDSVQHMLFLLLYKQ